MVLLSKTLGKEGWAQSAGLRKEDLMRMWSFEAGARVAKAERSHILRGHMNAGRSWRVGTHALCPHYLILMVSSTHLPY